LPEHAGHAAVDAVNIARRGHSAQPIPALETARIDRVVTSP